MNSLRVRTSGLITLNIGLETRSFSYIRNHIAIRYGPDIYVSNIIFNIFSVSSQFSVESKIGSHMARRYGSDIYI
jgi:hypothetical protein